MKLKIEIEMDNAAFEGNPAGEAGRILEGLAAQMGKGYALSDVGDHETLHDLNGNTVGKATVY